MASMSEEQKEYEALELVKKLDKLARWALRLWEQTELMEMFCKPEYCCEIQPQHIILLFLLQ
jgi:hypothetical protein